MTCVLGLQSLPHLDDRKPLASSFLIQMLIVGTCCVLPCKKGIPFIKSHFAVQVGHGRCFFGMLGADLGS